METSRSTPGGRDDDAEGPLASRERWSGPKYVHKGNRHSWAAINTMVRRLDRGGPATRQTRRNIDAPE